jgi:hypothetical protein
MTPVQDVPPRNEEGSQPAIQLRPQNYTPQTSPKYENSNNTYNDYGNNIVNTWSIARYALLYCSVTDTPYKFNITFKKADNYPVDLYFIMDLSQSMNDDKDKLAELGDTLGMC